VIFWGLGGHGSPWRREETAGGFVLGLDQLRPGLGVDGVFSDSNDGCKGLQPSKPLWTNVGRASNIPDA
jgi:hypothetical protein